MQISGTGLNQLSYRVIGAAYRVHSWLGPGLLESAYEEALAAELRDDELRYARQQYLRVWYNGRRLGKVYRPDFIVERSLVVEIKAIRKITGLELAQTLTYLKLSGCTLGLILNFNVANMQNGVRRVVLGYDDG
ncbi:MAG: GxxExxY protein [Longimicrobiales bacterium]|nr:GxxExxY protein [Longimicrobiales bacterium]